MSDDGDATGETTGSPVFDSSSSTAGASTQAGTTSSGEGSTTSDTDGEVATFTLTSSAFDNNASIPIAPYTCNTGKYPTGTSPPLAWTGAPAGTASFVLLMDDETINWDHWVVYDIPAGATGFDEGEIPAGSTQGVENTGSFTGYAGPCPPNGTHSYRFRLLALSVKTLDIDPGATLAQVAQQANPHALALAELRGTVAHADLP